MFALTLSLERNIFIAKPVQQMIAKLRTYPNTSTVLVNKFLTICFKTWIWRFAILLYLKSQTLMTNLSFPIVISRENLEENLIKVFELNSAKIRFWLIFRQITSDSSHDVRFDRKISRVEYSTQIINRTAPKFKFNASINFDGADVIYFSPRIFF